jgi:RNA polymerase sigma-70 factor (ECF subfamily)
VDAQILAALAGDNPAAFAGLVRLHQGGLRAFLLRLTRGDHALADDLAQESFIEAWRKRDQYRGEAPFAAWLHRIAWSRFLMTARKRKLEPLDAADEIPGIGADSDTKLDLERALTRLPAAQRAALTLCGAMGYSSSEVAAILELPEGTVKSHILRGRTRLRALLEGDKP